MVNNTEETENTPDSREEYLKQKALIDEIREQMNSISSLIQQETNRLKTLQDKMDTKIEEIRIFLEKNPVDDQEASEDSWGEDDIIWEEFADHHHPKAQKVEDAKKPKPKEIL
ncbi:hypothetical protein EIN_181250 [Entamoeba invadens IP1]|uniref:hypothetical protein n=1 Tax=Entamoeba invadens IP1 TaxID=370355 RepID=UPI0002C3EF7B|nr:hypothetical protein EIN_181250 [Entamoeba invadens IP1]ELP93968.1 hypothetical protein EIN_181250 [Entamoeba invadens IP1]|eukprot:XP_004260739.1 hypothetical protein EIN_181250 [Entamoeba invadens IP1]